MRFAVDSKCCRTIRLALIAVVEPITISICRWSLRENSILISPVLICRCRRRDDMCSSRFAHAQIQKRREDCCVHYIPRVDECSRCRVGELRKAKCCLLCSNEGTGGGDGGVSSEVGQCEREGIMRWSGSQRTGFTVSVAICIRNRLGALTPLHLAG